MARLNLEALVIEASSISLVRLVKSLKRFKGLKNFALLDYSQAEASLTFFYGDLPVFNRYFTVPTANGAVDTEKLMEILRLSVEYLKREFDSYVLDRFLIITDSGHDELTSLLAQELNADVEMLTPYDFTGQPESSLDSLKAFGPACVDKLPYRFRPALKKSEQYTHELKAGVITGLNKGLLSLILLAGAAASFSMYFVQKHDISQREAVISSLRREIDRTIEMSPDIRGAGVARVEEMISQKEQRIKSLRDLSSFSKKVAPVLGELPSLRPQGVWLEDLQLAGKTINIRGSAYLDDDSQEQLAIEEFISSISDNPKLVNLISGIEAGSKAREFKGNYSVTSFALRITLY